MLSFIALYPCYLFGTICESTNRTHGSIMNIGNASLYKNNNDYFFLSSNFISMDFLKIYLFQVQVAAELFHLEEMRW